MILNVIDFFKLVRSIFLFMLLTLYFLIEINIITLFYMIE